VLASTNRGSIISIAWPKDPEAAGRKQQEQQQGAANSSSLLANTAAGVQDDVCSAGGHAGQLMKHLSVQVGAGPLLSPRSSALTPAAKTPGSALSARTPHTAKTPHGAAAARTPGSRRVNNTTASSMDGAQQQQQLQVVLDGSGTAADSSDTYSVPASPGPMSPGPFSPAPISPNRSSRAWPAAEGAPAAAAVASRHGRMKEYRLHSSRITAIKVLHTAGVVFTAR
jgi:hypothetical protein